MSLVDFVLIDRHMVLGNNCLLFILTRVCIYSVKKSDYRTNIKIIFNIIIQITIFRNI